MDTARRRRVAIRRRGRRRARSAAPLACGCGTELPLPARRRLRTSPLVDASATQLSTARRRAGGCARSRRALPPRRARRASSRRRRASSVRASRAARARAGLARSLRRVRRWYWSSRSRSSCRTGTSFCGSSENGSFQNIVRTLSTVARFDRAASFFDESIRRSTAALPAGSPFQRSIASYIRSASVRSSGSGVPDAAASFASSSRTCASSAADAPGCPCYRVRPLHRHRQRRQDEHDQNRYQRPPASHG